MNRPAQSGNAIFLILIAVALFAAIGFTMMQGSRSSTDMMTNTMTTAGAYQSQEYANTVNAAAKRLGLRGCSDDQISYETPNGNAYNPQAPTDKSCHVFHIKGGGVVFAGSDVIKKVFATSATYPANFGGLAAGDAACNSLATAAGLSGNFRAWLSGALGNNPAATFTQSTQSYKLVDGTTVANSWTDLVDGTLMHAINLNESGATVGGNAWTGTASSGGNGNIISGTMDNCNTWTSTGTNGYLGQTSSTSIWSASAGTSACSGTARLYCFEQ